MLNRISLLFGPFLGFLSPFCFKSLAIKLIDEKFELLGEKTVDFDLEELQCVDFVGLEEEGHPWKGFLIFLNEKDNLLPHLTDPLKPFFFLLNTFKRNSS